MSNGTDQPNLFLLCGRNVRIRYQTTSSQGGPEFDYEDGRLSVNRRGDESRAEYTSIGSKFYSQEAVLALLQKREKSQGC